MPDNQSNHGIPRIIRREIEIKKKKKEEEETQEIYREFVNSFEETSNKGISRTWVRGGVVNPDENLQKPGQESKNKIYKPKLVQKVGLKFPLGSKSDEITPEKRTNTVESFKEELMRSQQNHKIMKTRGNCDKYKPRKSRFDLQSRKTTTITLKLPVNAEVPSKSEVAHVFGQYGCLSDVKSTREVTHVVFMNRLDAERAFTALNDKELKGNPMILQWGPPEFLLSIPTCRPPHIEDQARVPAPSGLPFNAQSDLKGFSVLVIIPANLSTLGRIHRMIEFVIREGPHFEAAMMWRERNNPDFAFLFDNQSQDHVYYRWKLFSLLQGDELYKWRDSEFVMFEGGPTWIPPRSPNFDGNGLIGTKSDCLSSSRKDKLPESDLKVFQNLLETVDSSRKHVGKLMCWCIQRAEYARDIVDRIVSSFDEIDRQADKIDRQTDKIDRQTDKTIAMIYLVSDILYNSGSKVAKASFYRQHFESGLERVIRILQTVHKSIFPSQKADQFKMKIMRCFRAWEDWAIYPNEFLIRLHNIFLDLLPVSEDSDCEVIEEEEDIDGEPLFDGGRFVALGDRSSEDIDGEPCLSEYIL